MADIDFSKYGDPVKPESAGGVDFTQYGDPVGTPRPSGSDQVGAALESGGRGAMVSGGTMAGAALGLLDGRGG